MNNVIREEAVTRLRIHCANNRKTCHLHYESFRRADCIEKLQPNSARVIFKAATRMSDIKVNFKMKITLIFGVPFAKEKMKPLTICLYVTLVCSAPQLYRVRI